MFVAGLCFWTGFTGLTPVLPEYIEQFGASGQQIGLVMTSFAIGLLMVRPLMSRMTDERGRKPVILIGLLAIAVTPLLFGLVSILPIRTWQVPIGSSHWPINSAIALMIAFRVFHGVSIAAFVTTYSVLVADFAPPSQRGALIAYMGLVNPIGTGLGPLLGGYLKATSGFIPVFLVIAGMGLVGFFCATQITEPERAIAPSPSNKAFWSLIWLPAIRTPALLLMLVGISFGSLMTFLPLYARESNLVINVGLFYTASAVCSFLVQLWVGGASDRLGRGPFITLALVFYFLSMMLLWRAQGSVFVLLALGLEGFGGGMLMPMIESLMADRSDPSERGLMFGLCLVGFDIGIALAGPVMGQVADLSSYRNIFGVDSLIILLGLLIFITHSSKGIQCSIKFSLRGGNDIYALPR